MQRLAPCRDGQRLSSIFHGLLDLSNKFVRQSPIPVRRQQIVSLAFTFVSLHTADDTGTGRSQPSSQYECGGGFFGFKADSAAVMIRGMMPTTTPAITAIYRLPSDSVLAQIRADIGSSNLLPAFRCDSAKLVLTDCDVDQHSMILLFGLSHGVGRLARWDWLQRLTAKSMSSENRSITL